MLSRVAERMYWGARYLERAENTARLVRVYDAALLDLPRDAGVDWPLLVDICGARQDFDARFPQPDDRDTLRFLIADPDSPSSIVASLGQARENFRTTRDLCPTEAWRCVNELYLYGRKSLPKIASPRRRHEVLSEIVQGVQQLTGLLSGTMSHGDAYHFIRLGRNLERADMTTRIIDIAAASLLEAEDAVARFENTLWMAVLKSLSGYQMYRQYVRRRIRAEDVIRFLLNDPLFPRAVSHCLLELEASMLKLPKHQAPLHCAVRLQRILDAQRTGGIEKTTLRNLMDDLQLELAQVHAEVSGAWFLPDRAA
ncbi:alpha-E domain-containing protein [Wenzhouxiangella sp. XN24]|uniref:alpha-E domain-containing protein n=1 Tax=Wenzhouxiangella sp. XN24 TaxID=2713569 RepID=UPI0013EC1EEC|nr:alpha-E domain-containing protein [Wenzhouxiangella sp. XN24]NGX14919.1 alpha-E domain-containing protein [Wenzhouxiangella sp. XN24]